jgi:hypothetical protein
VTALALVAGVVVGLGVVVFAGTRMLRNHDGTSSGVGNAFGAGFDVFDPGASRSRADLEEKHELQLQADPGDGERPVRVDLHGGTVHIKRPKP